MIEVENLSKYYGTYPAVRDVTFNVERGEILGFLGPNGAGKTTTMRIITGYVPATAGRVRVAGFDVAEKSMQARQHLGYLPETVPLYTELTPYEYLDFRGRIAGMHNGRERKARVWEVMDQLNIQDVSNKLIGSLSRGYRQRVGLAQAMLHNPDVLILDEPTVGLDPVQITEVRDLIRRLGENHTVILSTHLLPEVSMVCNRVIIINRGRLVALDTPFHLAGEQNPVITLEAAGPRESILSALKAIPGVLQVSADGQSAEAMNGATTTFTISPAEGAEIRSQVASAVVGAGHELLELKTIRPTLEDIFLQIITEDTADSDLEFVEEGELAEGMLLDDDGMESDDEEAEAVGARRDPAAPVRARRRTRR
jgi:ABC-2 type transport system ATP-binding protein